MSFDVIAHLVRRLDDIERRHANMERHGTITDVDNDKGMVKMTDGIFSSDWLPWHEHNSNGGIKTRTMPTKGSQCVARAMSGQLEIGTVTHSVYPTDTNKMPDAKNGEHVWQMGDDDTDSNGQPKKDKKQVKHVTDAAGNHDRSATGRHGTTVGDYSHTMTPDGGHQFKAGDKVSFTMTKDGGHQFKAGDSFSLTVHPSDGLTLSANGQDMKLNDSGILMNAITAFAKSYGVGSAAGAISQLDNATAGNGAKIDP